MSKIITYIYLVIVLVTFGGAVYAVNEQKNNAKTLNELEVRVDVMEDEIVKQTVFSIIENPDFLFRFLEDAPVWEEIDAVPYSRCYRHLIGTTTADYIFCKAI